MTRSERPVTAVILAAGKGTRMRSELPKVLHGAAGRPLLAWVEQAARGAGCERILVVVGHGSERIRRAFADVEVSWVEQRRQRGTGHALAQVAPLTKAATLLVLSGDVPLVRPETLGRLLRAMESGWGAMAVAELEAPGSLGRVICRPDGALERIVEAVDATRDELAVRRVNAGIYALPAPEIFRYLERLRPDNAKGELYLTDALGMAVADGHAILPVVLDDADEALGVNTRSDLARVHRALLARKAEELQRRGVTLWDAARTVIEPQVDVGADTEIHPAASLLGGTTVGRGCVIHQGAWIRDSEIADGAVIEPHSVLDGARVGAGCRVGPFARLRPGAVLEDEAKVGNFVEVKNSRLGRGVKANHLSYLGDATVGDHSNIGAGAITCNYDGFAKHPTRIGRRVSIGSDTMLVAPVEVGDEAETGAGSVITADVEPGALAVERSRQRSVPGWAARKKRRKEGES